MNVALNRMFVDEEIKRAVLEVLESGWYVKGPRAGELEELFCTITGSEFAVSCSSGTSALMLAFASLGLGQGDEVLVPSHTFAASVNGFYHLGVRPIFVDIDPETYTMDVEDMREKATDRTRAILPVHLYGHPADMDPIIELARERDLKVVSDACQSHGALYRGKDVGAIGDIICYSFFPSKIITVAGEGGIITCRSREHRDLMKALANHGRFEGERDIHRMPGYNMRLSEILAAVGAVQLKHIGEWVERRREIARVYTEELDGVGDMVTPHEADWASHAYYLYVIRSASRDALKEHLARESIASGIHYPIPVHKMPYLEGNTSLPVTERVVDEILSIPMHPLLEEEEQKLIIGSIRRFYRR